MRRGASARACSNTPGTGPLRRRRSWRSSSGQRRSPRSSLPQRWSASSAHASHRSDFVSADPHRSATGGVHLPALIDDDTPPPEHARHRLSRLAAVVGVGLLLWVASLGALAVLLGWPHALTQMGWFFTKAALLTFGGAYAVLAVRGARRRRSSRLAQRGADDRRPGARGNDAGPADHGRRLRRLRRRLWTGLVRARVAVRGGRHRRDAGHLVHVPAVVRVHPGGRAAGRIDAWRPEVHRAADGDHRGGGRRDREPGAVLRTARALAAGSRWTVRCFLCAACAGRGGGAVRLPAQRRARHRGVRAGGLAITLWR